MERSLYKPEVINESNGNRKHEFLSLIGGSPDIIFVFGGAQVYNKNTGQYHSSGYFDRFNGDRRTLGSRYRVMAALELGHTFPDSRIITAGSLKQKPSDSPSHAAVMAKELHDQGISEERIIQVSEPRSTSQEVVAAIRNVPEILEAGDRGKTGERTHHLVFISNSDHMQRVIPMFNEILNGNTGFDSRLHDVSDRFSEDAERFRSMRIQVTFLDAEKILAVRYPNFRRVFSALQKTGRMRYTRNIELQGALAVQKNNYKVDSEV